MSNLLIAYRHLHRKSCDTVRTMYNVILWCFFAKVCQCRTDMELNTLCHTLTDFHIMLTAHIFLNIRSEVITCYTDRVITYDTTQRNDRNLCATTTDINNHVTLWSFYIKTHTEGSCHWLKDKVDITTISVFCRITNGTKFNLSRTRWNTNNHTQ